MSTITDEVIRKLDADYIASLIADKESQRKEIEVLQQTIGGLEWNLEDREIKIRLLKKQIERMREFTGTP